MKILPAPGNPDADVAEIVELVGTGAALLIEAALDEDDAAEAGRAAARWLLVDLATIARAAGQLVSPEKMVGVGTARREEPIGCELDRLADMDRLLRLDLPEAAVEECKHFEAVRAAISDRLARELERGRGGCVMSELVDARARDVESAA